MSSPEEAKALMAEILNRWEFAGSTRFEPLARFLERLLSYLLHPYLLTGAGVIAAALVLGLLSRHLVKNKAGLEKEAPLSRETSGHAGHAFRAAGEAAAAGDYSTALRLLFLSLLRLLESRGELRCHFSTTNGEYLRQLRAAGYPAWETFRQMVDLFEEKRYGGNRCDRDDYLKGLQLYRLIEEKVR